MMAIKQVPLEIMIKIMEKLKFKDAVKLCEDLKISEEMAYQYHKFDKMYHSSLWSKIYDYRKRKILNPNLAKAVLKNFSFQSASSANEKVRFAMLSQDLDLVRDALKDPKVDHDDMSWRFLMDACRFGQLDAVKLLVNEYGINISASDNEALSEACWKGYADIVKYILSHPDFNPEGCSGAFIPAYDNLDVVQLLLSDPRFDPSYKNNQAIINVANTEIFKLLLADPRVDPSDQENQAIINSAESGNTEIFKLLLADPRIDPSDQDNQTIINAAKGGNVEIFKLLLEDPRVNPSDQENQAIVNSAEIGNTEIFKLLLEDPRVNPSDRENQAIVNSAEIGNTEIFKLLLADPRVDPCDQENQAIIEAAYSGNMENIRLLLANWKQNTPQIIKSTETVVEMVKLLSNQR